MVPKCSINLIFFETNTKQKKRINFKGSNPLFPSKKTEISDFWSFFDPKINSKIGQKLFNILFLFLLVYVGFSEYFDTHFLKIGQKLNSQYFIAQNIQNIHYSVS